MGNLTETAQTTRAAIIVGSIMLVSIMVGLVLFNFAKQVYVALNPPATALPTVGFGQLPRIQFPEKETGELTYRLETIGNKLPNFDSKVEVYLITFPRSTFLDLDRAKKQAASLGFVFEPEEVSENVYRWINTSTPQGVLTMDIVNSTFNMEVAWETDPGFLSQRQLPSLTAAAGEARNFLKKGQFLPKDMEKGLDEVAYLKYSGGTFSETISLSDADFVSVDLFRAPVKEKRVVTGDLKGVAHLIISGARGSGKRFVEVNYRHTNVVYDQFHTYPIITTAQAWQLLQQGAGYVARPPVQSKEMVIRSVSLGYYDTLDGQRFLQPVYIFEGDEDVVAYVPAVHPDMFLAQ